MVRLRFLMFFAAFSLFVSPTAMAQFPVVTAGEVKAYMAGKQKIVLIDARPPQEYREGHIPKAINIPAETVKMHAARLPKDKSIPLIFYCRGTG